MEKDNTKVSVVRQCELLNLLKSSYYYNSAADDGYNLELIGFMDGQYTKAPFYKVRRMTAWLRAQDYKVNVKRVYEVDNVVQIRKPINSAYRSYFSVQAIGIASLLNTRI